MSSARAIELAQIAGRVAIIYVALIALLRLAGRRTMSDVMPMDIMTMLLLSETVSPALTAGDDSVLGGVVAAITLIALSVATSALVFRVRGAERLISGAPIPFIKDGRVDPKVVRRFRVTDADLRQALHQQGLLEVAQVARGFVECDGELTLVPKE